MEGSGPEGLAELMEGQVQVHRALVDVLREKRDALVRGDLEGLERAVEAEEFLIARAARTGQLYARASEGVDWAQADPEVVTRHERSRRELERLVARLHELNEANSQLLKNSLRYVEAALRALRRYRGLTYEPRK